MTAGLLEIGRGPLRVTVAPHQGGRLVSLTADGREWLAPSADLRQLPDAGTPFVRPGMGGWDEVVPTVAATTLPDGRPLTDHGEAWRRPWVVESTSAAAVTMSLVLTSLPLTLRRTLEVSDSALRLTYALEAAADAPGDTPVLWSAHPQFAAPAGTRLALDRGPLALAVQHPAGAQELRFDDDDVLAGLPSGTAVKAFVSPHERVDHARVIHPDGTTLTLRWDAESVPYLGLWWDNASCAADPVIAVEPTTGHGDDAARALASRRLLTLPPGGRRSWWLAAEVTGVAVPVPVYAAHTTDREA